MKKYDLVIGTGCSFMNGDAIHDLDGNHVGRGHTPTEYLSKKLKCNFKNLAQSGSSNDHMIFRLLSYIENNNLNNKSVLVIIGLSELARLFLKEGSDLHPHHLLKDNKQKTADKHFEGDVSGLENYIKFYMTHIFDVEFYEKLISQKIILLKNYFENKGIDYIIFNSLSGYLNLEDIIAEENTIIFDNEEKIWYISLKKKHEKEFGNFNNQEFRSPTPPWGRYFCNGHPSPHANKDLADLLYKKIVNNGWI